MASFDAAAELRAPALVDACVLQVPVPAEAAESGARGDVLPFLLASGAGLMDGGGGFFTDGPAGNACCGEVGGRFERVEPRNHAEGGSLQVSIRQGLEGLGGVSLISPGDGPLLPVFCATPHPLNPNPWVVPWHALPAEALGPRGMRRYFKECGRLGRSGGEGKDGRREELGQEPEEGRGGAGARLASSGPGRSADLPSLADTRSTERSFSRTRALERRLASLAKEENRERLAEISRIMADPGAMRTVRDTRFEARARKWPERMLGEAELVY